MIFFESVLNTLSNGFNFSGKAKFSEFWYFVVFNFFLIIILCFIGFFSGAFLGLFVIYFLVISIPFTALFCRRYKDAGIPRIFIFLPLLYLLLVLLWLSVI